MVPGDEPRPFEIIDALARELSRLSDEELLAELAGVPALSDESDSCWSQSSYWNDVAYRYLALAQVAGERRLRPAIRLLLDRACYGDPGEIMRGLRHTFEAIVNPDWASLADVCIEAARGGRPGTVLWAVDQLMVLDDERARPLLKELATKDDEEIRWRAEAALARLNGES